MINTLTAFLGFFKFGMDELFSDMYSDTGRPSIAPERLLHAQTLQILYTVRSE